MNNIITIMQKEIKLFFRSSLGPLVLFIFSLICGIILLNICISFVEQNLQITSNTYDTNAFIDQVVFRFFGNLNFVFLFMFPIISMHIFSSEFNAKTFYLYQNFNVQKYQLIIGKYLALVLIGIIFLSTTFIAPILMSMIGLKEVSLLFSSYLGLLFNLFLFASIGLFTSSLFNLSIISALTSFGIIFFFWMLSFMAQNNSNFFIANLLGYSSMLVHFEDIVRGMLRITHLVYGVSFVLFFLIATHLTLKVKNS